MLFCDRDRSLGLSCDGCYHHANKPFRDCLLKKNLQELENNHKFRETLLKELSLTNIWNNNMTKFIGVCVRRLDKHAPIKKRYSRGNHLHFMNKELFKAIMHRLKVRNNFM